MINSIYTNKEIFLRELISNASDAVDKLNFKSLQDPSVKLDQGDLAIRVSFDKDARTITISDNGIGMTAEELERNLGTIAHSGSEEFKTENAEQQGSDVDIIGQFGVGFYSAFMVASHVKVVSRAYGEDTAHVWESDGLEGYTIEDGERAEHGTDVILTLRENEKLDADGEAETYDRFLTEWGLKSLIQQYSNYVRYPIQMRLRKSRQKPKPEDAGDDYKPEYEDYQELETINSMTPLAVMLIAALILKEPVTFKKAAGVLIGASGALLIIFQSSAINTDSSGNWIGNLLCIVNVITYAIYLVITRPISQRYSAITLMKWMFLFSALISFPPGISDLPEAKVFGTESNPFVILKLSYIVIMATGIAYFLVPMALKRIRPTTASMYNNLQPIIASIIAILIGQDVFSWDKPIAALLVFTGVYLVTQSKAKEEVKGIK